MVFAALVAGLVIGLLAPSPSPPQRAESSSAKAARPVPATAAPRAPVIEQALREAAHANASKKPSTDAKLKQTCEQQAWPYLNASCIDRTVKSPDAVQMINVRTAEPAFALSDEQENNKREAAKKEDDDTNKEENAASKEANREAAPKPVQPASTLPRQKNEAAPPARRADRRRPRRWDEPERRFFEVPDDWDGSRPRAYVQPDGRLIYVYPERRYFQRRLPDGW